MMCLQVCDFHIYIDGSRWFLPWKQKSLTHTHTYNVINEFLSMTACVFCYPNATLYLFFFFFSSFLRRICRRWGLRLKSLSSSRGIPRTASEESDMITWQKRKAKDQVLLEESPAFTYLHSIWRSQWYVFSTSGTWDVLNCVSVHQEGVSKPTWIVTILSTLLHLHLFPHTRQIFHLFMFVSYCQKISFGQFPQTWTPL